VIDPNWQLVDLDPYTWRAIGKFIDPGMYIRAGSPDENGLFVIHDDGRVLSVVETSGAARKDLGLITFDAPRPLAKELYESGAWDRVHVIDRRHLEHVGEQAQQLPNRDLDLDAYYRNVFSLIWGSDDGYVSLPPHPGHWHGWTYSAISEVVGQFVEPASLALGVISEESGDLEIGLVGEVSEGQFHKVTTFEALPFERSEAAVTQSFMMRVWMALESTAYPPAAVLLCTDTIFDEWVYGADKEAVIGRARMAGTAILRLRADPQVAW
jgi:hypothetical protein